MISAKNNSCSWLVFLRETFVKYMLLYINISLVYILVWIYNSYAWSCSNFCITNAEKINYYLLKYYKLPISIYESCIKRGPVSVATSWAIPGRRIDRADGPFRANLWFFFCKMALPFITNKPAVQQVHSFFIKPLELHLNKPTVWEPTQFFLQTPPLRFCWN